MGHLARMAAGTSVACVDCRQPFSNFSYIREHYPYSCGLHRTFSQARGHLCETVVIEDIVEAGAVADENAMLRTRFPTWQGSALIQRLTFWRGSF